MGAASDWEDLSRNMAFAYRRIAERAGRPSYLDDDVSVADQGVPFPFGANNVTVLRPVSDGASIVRRADAVYKTRRYLVWSLWPVDLAALGFTRSESPAMVRPAGPLEATETDLAVREVTDAAAAASFGRTLTAGFGYDQRGLTIAEVFNADVLGDDRLRLWLGTLDARPVAASWSAVIDGHVGIYGVATVPDARRRGYGEALTRAAIAVAPDLPATLQASTMGRPLYERLGFKEVGRFEVWRPVAG